MYMINLSLFIAVSNINISSYIFLTDFPIGFGSVLLNRLRYISFIFMPYHILVFCSFYTKILTKIGR